MNRSRLLVLVAVPLTMLALSEAAVAASLPVATPKVITNTTGGKNQNSSVDKSGRMIVFTSNVNDSGATTFNFNGAGNAFGLTTPCSNCANVDGNGELYLWHLKPKFGDPANAFMQLTNTAGGGGFDANRFPDLNQKANTVAWDSDQDHLPAAPGNADANREIFLLNLTTFVKTQVTNTVGGGGSANENVNLTDDGQQLVFDSSRDFSGASNCTLVDGTSACDNLDGNNEVMLYSRAADKLTQVTVTTTGGGNANIRPRISNDGKFIAFQSTRDFSGALAGGATCKLIDGVTACDNADGNGEIMRYDIAVKAFAQVTKSAPNGSCSGTNPNERVEISKGGKYISFQSKCENELNPGGCGSCDGGDNDEAFLADLPKKKLLQVTISDSGFNRVPRIVGSGRYMVFETTKTYNGLATSGRTLYIVKRDTKAGTGTVTGKGQLLDDPGAGLTQNPKTKATTITFDGGFNSSIEQFGASTSGKYYSFDNKKGVGNQEVWYLDRTK